MPSARFTDRFQPCISYEFCPSGSKLGSSFRRSSREPLVPLDIYTYVYTYVCMHVQLHMYLYVSVPFRGSRTADGPCQRQIDRKPQTAKAHCKPRRRALRGNCLVGPASSDWPGFGLQTVKGQAEIPLHQRLWFGYCPPPPVTVG